MSEDIFNLLGLAIWILVIVAGLLAFLYPFLEGAGVESRKEKV